MTSNAVPPVNLKDRIAALQQRNVSPSQHPSTQPPNKNAPAPAAGGLRDRIAKFEKKGGTPVPRASFGANVPQLPENAPAKKRGELYGNRVEGLGRPLGPPLNQPSSSPPAVDEPPKCCISDSPAGLGSFIPAQNNVNAVPPLPSNAAFPRSNSITSNPFGTRRVTSPSEASFGTIGREPSTLPVTLSSEESTTIPNAVPVTDIATLVQEPSDLPETTSVAAVSAVEDNPKDPRIAVNVKVPNGNVPVSTESATEEPNAEVRQEIAVTVAERSNGDGAIQAALTEVVCGVASPVGQENTPKPSLDRTPKQSLDMVASQLDKVSPVAPAKEVVVSKAEVEVTFSSPAVVAPPALVIPTKDEVPTVTVTPSPASMTRVTVEATPSKRVPNTPVSASPSHEGSDVGTIKIIRGDSNQSKQPTEPKSIIPRQTFTAVVHRKKTEMPTAPVPASTLQAPITPHITRARQNGNVATVPTASPGFGDLAALLEEAAMLERRLTEGEILLTPNKQEPSVPIESPDTSTRMETVPEEDLRSGSVPAYTHESFRMADFADSISISDQSISVPSIKEWVIQDNIVEESPDAQRTPKSPLPKYLSGIRRFASSSSRRSSAVYPRDSTSVSSEDSASVITPLDAGFDERSEGIPWPTTTSPKKSVNMGRSTSFADRFFNRNRTRSTMSSTEEDDSALRSPTSNKYHTVSGTSDSSPTKRPHARNLVGAPLTRPDSTASLASTVASGLFDRDIFDAFPSVPENVPAAPQSHLSPDDFGRTPNLPVKSRKHAPQRLSMV